MQMDSNQKHREVWRYFIENGHNQTLWEIGQKLGYSQSYVSFVLSKFLPEYLVSNGIETRLYKNIETIISILPKESILHKSATGWQFFIHYDSLKLNDPLFTQKEDQTFFSFLWEVYDYYFGGNKNQ